MPGMGWTALLNTPADGPATAVNTFTTATDVSRQPHYTLPAGFSVNGTSLSFRAWGVFSTTATPTLTLGIYWGGVAGTALATTGAITTGSGVTNVPWRIELDTIISAKGATGTAVSQGLFGMGTTVAAWNWLPIPNTAQADVTVDTTNSKVLTVGAAWSASSASNTITVRGFKIFSDGL
jgi:hypothetical protein